MADDTGFTVRPEPGTSTDDEILVRLERLSALEYERERESAAEQLRVRVSMLDRLIEARRNGNGNGFKVQGRPLRIPRPEPWQEPVHGDWLLNSLAEFFSQHVFLPVRAADALAAWTLHTYCFTRFRHSPRLALTSPRRRCGKTTLLEALEFVVCKPLSTANLSVAAMFRIVEAVGPTLLIDEADTFLSEEQELQGALNAGHKRGGQFTRCEGDSFEPHAYSVFAPAAVAAIGRLPGTLEDRSLILRMQRATRAERPAPLHAEAEEKAKQLASKCARWAADSGDKLATADPPLPPALFNRTADNWRPLFAIAQVAGGDWFSRLEKATAALVPDDDDDGLSVRLLADIRDIFHAQPSINPISSKELCEALLALESSPWPEVNKGRPLTPSRLAALLRPYRIVPGTVRMEERNTPKGYRRAAFEDAWRRYLPVDQPSTHPPAGVAEPPHRHNPQKSSGNGFQQPPHGYNGVAAADAQKSRISAGCGGVAAPAPQGRPEGDVWAGSGDLDDLEAAEAEAIRSVDGGGDGPGGGPPPDRQQRAIAGGEALTSGRS